MREILEGLKDGTKAALIKSDQSKAFDKVHHDVPQPAGGDASERETLAGVRDRAVGPAGLPPISFSLCPRFRAPALGAKGRGWQTYPIVLAAVNGLEETAEHAFYDCDRVRPFWDHVREWMACIEPKQVVLFDVGYVVDNILPQFQSECGVSRDPSCS